MPFKPAPRIRKHAKPLEPLVDPAGWTADELAASDDWIYELSEAEQADICKAVSHIEREGVPILDITRENFPCRNSIRDWQHCMMSCLKVAVSFSYVMCR